MRGIFVKKPTLKKSRHVWDVSIVMNKLKTLYPFHSLTRNELTLKCVMLLLMLTGQRGQTVHLKCTDVKFENKKKKQKKFLYKHVENIKTNVSFIRCSN